MYSGPSGQAATISTSDPNSDGEPERSTAPGRARSAPLDTVRASSTSSLVAVGCRSTAVRRRAGDRRRRSSPPCAAGGGRLAHGEARTSPRSVEPSSLDSAHVTLHVAGRERLQEVDGERQRRRRRRSGGGDRRERVAVADDRDVVAGRRPRSSNVSTICRRRRRQLGAVGRARSRRASSGRAPARRRRAGPAPHDRRRRSPPTTQPQRAAGNTGSGVAPLATNVVRLHRAHGHATLGRRARPRPLTRHLGRLDRVATQSLYRRYRPRRFGELKGQDHVVRALRDAVAERPRGPGLPVLRAPRHGQDDVGADPRQGAQLRAPGRRRAVLRVRVVPRRRARHELRRPRARRRQQQRRRRDARPHREGRRSARPGGTRCTSSTRSTCSPRRPRRRC